MNVSNQRRPSQQPLFDAFLLHYYLSIVIRLNKKESKIGFSMLPPVIACIQMSITRKTSNNVPQYFMIRGLQD